MTSALAAYNGSGTQGTAVTTKLTGSDDGDVQSAFWNTNDTTRFLLFGSSIQEIPTSGGQSVGPGGNQIFTVNNDLDCLGDVYVQVDLSVEGTPDEISPPVGRLKPWGLVKFLTRIEFMVGTQVWQTMEAADLINIINTELPEGAYENLAYQANGNQTTDGAKAYADPSRGLYAGRTVSASIKLPLLTKTLQPMLSKFADMTEDGYLMAAAPHQQVKIKLFYSSLSDVTDATSGCSFKVTLYGKQQIMCNAERQQLKAMPMGLPKRIKMTQNATSQISFTKNQTASAIDLDHFSLYASYLVVSMTELDTLAIGTDSDIGTGATSWASAPINGGVRFVLGGVKSAELLLNSTSVSGVLPGEFLTSSAAESLGLYSNLFTQGRNLSYGAASGFFVFPLASHAYDASAVPLNRFDNIRLKITPNQDSSSTSHVTVTCVGETTALYKGGAASLAMY